MKNHQPLSFHLKFSDKELLKELLYILRVRGDIDSIAEAAIGEFGNVSAVLRQSRSELKKIKGFTPTVIKRIKTIYSLFREMIKPDSYPAEPAQNFENLSYFMLTAPKFDGESLRLLFLDEDHVILKDFIYKKGFGNEVTFYFREIVKEVLKVGVSSIVLIHHKISSSPKPSQQDKKRFAELQVGFKGLDIKLVDYLIISENAAFSFKNSKLYP